jgi:hypothetical protein
MDFTVMETKLVLKVSIHFRVRAPVIPAHLIDAGVQKVLRDLSVDQPHHHQNAEQMEIAMTKMCVPSIRVKADHVKTLR